MITANDNESSQLAFPIQITPPGQEQSVGHLAVEVRVILAARLNQVALGEIELTEELKNSVRLVNEIYQRVGYQTIDVDFD